MSIEMVSRIRFDIEFPVSGSFRFTARRVEVRPDRRTLFRESTVALSGIYFESLVGEVFRRFWAQEREFPLPTIPRWWRDCTGVYDVPGGIEKIEVEAGFLLLIREVLDSKWAPDLSLVAEAEPFSEVIGALLGLLVEAHQDGVEVEIEKEP